MSDKNDTEYSPQEPNAGTEASDDYCAFQGKDCSYIREFRRVMAEKNEQSLANFAVPVNPNDLPCAPPTSGWPKYKVNGLVYQLAPDGALQLVRGLGPCPACGQLLVDVDMRACSVVCLNSQCHWHERIQTEESGLFPVMLRLKGAEAQLAAAQLANEKLDKDKLALKIVLRWIGSLAAKGALGEDHSGAIFGIADRAVRNPGRTELLREAPEWLRKEFPKYGLEETANASHDERSSEK